ncbi:MAG: DNA-directed polymerase, partial [Frankiales bacterium]|nr:DNA-directed polymerase [Frankiales bacterium]
MLAVVLREGIVGLADGARSWVGSLLEVASSADRLVVWSAGSTRLLPLRPRQYWDLAAVHKVLYGGRRDDPASIWAAVHELPPPARADVDLTLLDSSLAVVAGFDGPVQPDGALHPEAFRLAPLPRLAELALEVQALQQQRLEALPDPRAVATGPPLRLVTAWAESAAALLCTELEADGLPVDRSAALDIIASVIGDGDRADRDRPVLDLFRGDQVDLRNPASVRDALLRLGIDVPDTRSWRLEAYRAAHPVVAALLTWRKTERMATTYGYGWI